MPPVPGPRDPSSPRVPLLHGCRRHAAAAAAACLLTPPDTVPSLGDHPPPSLGGQEGVNTTRKGLKGREKAVPTRLRCQGDGPALMGPSPAARTPQPR